MQPEFRTIETGRAGGEIVLQQNKVLRNTYMLLGLSLNDRRANQESETDRNERATHEKPPCH